MEFSVKSKQYKGFSFTRFFVNAGTLTLLWVETNVLAGLVW